ARSVHPGVGFRAPSPPSAFIHCSTNGLRVAMRLGKVHALACIAAPLLACGCAHLGGLPPRPFIRNVEFRGADHARPADLRQGLANQETSWLTFTRKRYYTPSALDDDKQRVAAWYAAHGFFDARVTGTEVKPRWHNSVDLYFDVE